MLDFTRATITVALLIAIRVINRKKNHELAAVLHQLARHYDIKPWFN